MLKVRMGEKFKTKKFIILTGVVLLVILGFILGSNFINLKGNEEVVVSVGNSYLEPGYGGILKDSVVVDDNINPRKIGKYKVKYKIKGLGSLFQKTRIIEVKDEEAPVINLKGEENISICPKAEYKEEGYSASDNYDGDLTDKVEVVENDSEIIYQVSDSSKNKTVMKRYLDRVDDKKPSITLKGGSSITLVKGSKYKELGASAKDNCDGDISKNIKITNNVNNKKVGTYTVSYEVADSKGNKSVVTRKVKVVNKTLKSNSTSGGRKVIYLTFDDGPSKSITPGVLKILKEENVKATFFVINHDDSLNYLIKQAYNEGHSIGLHSYTHNYKKVYASEKSYFNDLNKISDKVYKITGVRSKIIRFPGGSSNTVSSFNPKIMTKLTSRVKEKGYYYYDWNVGSGDAGNTTSKKIYKSVTKGLGSGNNVVLMHDFENNNKTLNVLRDIIKYGKENGYTFDKITTKTREVHHGVNN